jgi:HEAT repeat protein
MDPAPFARALAAALLGDGGDGAVREAHRALHDALRESRSVVFEVQFTGFAEKGRLVGGVDPVLLRAAAHLITLRVDRVGFTADASVEDLECFVRTARSEPRSLGPGGILEPIAAAAPRGVFVGTTSGEGYRPPPPEPREPAPGTPVSSGDPSPAATDPAAIADPQGGEETELAAFEILDSMQAVPAAPEPPPAGPTPPDAIRHEQPGATDMYQFFRASGGGDAGAEHLPGLLAAADTVTRFDELAESASRQAAAMLRSDAHAPALALLHALIREAERADRSRLFRESAVQALRRAANQETLHRLIERLPFAGEDRDTILAVFGFLGSEALLLLEPLLHRSDPELRSALFSLLVRAPATSRRLSAHALEDPSPVRARTLLQLARGGGADPALGARWAAELAAHPDPVVRLEAARTAAASGPAGARVLVDLLSDGAAVVRREAITGLGVAGGATAVPFLARILAENDEEMQCAAAAALGTLGVPEAVRPLLELVRKRSFLPLRRATRARLAAAHALGRIDTSAAREALRSLADGSDEIAAEARRLLGG